VRSQYYYIYYIYYYILLLLLLLLLLCSCPEAYLLYQELVCGRTRLLKFAIFAGRVYTRCGKLRWWLKIQEIGYLARIKWGKVKGCSYICDF